MRQAGDQVGEGRGQPARLERQHVGEGERDWYDQPSGNIMGTTSAGVRPPGRAAGREGMAQPVQPGAPPGQQQRRRLPLDDAAGILYAAIEELPFAVDAVAAEIVMNDAFETFVLAGGVCPDDDEGMWHPACGREFGGALLRMSRGMADFQQAGHAPVGEDVDPPALARTRHHRRAEAGGQAWPNSRSSCRATSSCAW